MKRKYSGLLLLTLGLICGTALAAEYPARLQWAERLSLSSPVSGVIDAVAVRPGQSVAAGDLLVALDRRLHKARLVEARSLLEKAKQEHEEAQRELERTQELFDRTLLSIHDLQVVQIAATRAEAELGQARAQETEARLKLEYSRLQAPYAARVVAVSARVGETLVSRCEARPLVVLAPVGRMAARALLGADQITDLAPGDAARVRVGDAEYPGEVVEAGLESASESGREAQYPLRVRFDLRDGVVLRPGQAAMIVVGE